MKKKLIIILVIVGIFTLGSVVYFVLVKNPVANMPIQASIPSSTESPATVTTESPSITTLSDNTEDKNQNNDIKINCYDTPKYFVILQSSYYRVLQFLIKNKTSTNQRIPCDYIADRNDFEMKDLEAMTFLALTDNFLVLDQGTGVHAH